MSKNLVELMAKYIRSNNRDLFEDPFDTCPEKVAKEALSVVKEHIGLVAEVCPECRGEGMHFQHGVMKDCPECKNNCGIIARMEEVD
jgi:hypothetical protein